MITPKFAPAPRMAQNRSGCSVLETVIASPAAVTSRTDTRESSSKPRRPYSTPSPPPSVGPTVLTQRSSVRANLQTPLSVGTGRCDVRGDTYEFPFQQRTKCHRPGRSLLHSLRLPGCWRGPDKLISYCSCQYSRHSAHWQIQL